MLHADVTLVFFPGPAVWLWSRLKFFLQAPPWLAQELRFSFFWSFENAFLMLSQSKWKRNWILCHEREGWERRDFAPLPLVQGGPFFQKQISHSNRKYFLICMHATWTFNDKKRKSDSYNLVNRSISKYKSYVALFIVT